jgi:hypothetical protein
MRASIVCIAAARYVHGDAVDEDTSDREGSGPFGSASRERTGDGGAWTLGHAHFAVAAR